VTSASFFSPFDYFIATLAHCGLRVHRGIVSIAAFFSVFVYFITFLTLFCVCTVASFVPQYLFIWS